MKKLHTVIALFGAAFFSAACAGARDGHAHQHSAASPAQHSDKTMKEGMKAPMEQKSRTTMPMAGKGKIMMAQVQGANAMTDGQIKRINRGSKKITIKHGQITNLDMPPMTMVFRVSDDAMLDKVKKGDKVRFRVEDQNGAMVITEMMPAQ